MMKLEERVQFVERTPSRLTTRRVITIVAALSGIVLPWVLWRSDSSGPSHSIQPPLISNDADDLAFARRYGTPTPIRMHGYVIINKSIPLCRGVVVAYDADQPTHAISSAELGDEGEFLLPNLCPKTLLMVKESVTHDPNEFDEMKKRLPAHMRSKRTPVKSSPTSARSAEPAGSSAAQRELAFNKWRTNQPSEAKIRKLAELSIDRNSNDPVLKSLQHGVFLKYGAPINGELLVFALEEGLNEINIPLTIP